MGGKVTFADMVPTMMVTPRFQRCRHPYSTEALEVAGSEHKGDVRDHQQQQKPLVDEFIGQECQYCCYCYQRELVSINVGRWKSYLDVDWFDEIFNADYVADNLPNAVWAAGSATPT